MPFICRPPEGTGPKCAWGPQVWWGDADSVIRLAHWQQRRDLEGLPRITHVCNTAAKTARVPYQDRVPGVQYLDLQMFDLFSITRRSSLWPHIERDLRRAVAFVEEAVRDGGIVLINCWAGQNRSGSVILTWLLTHKVPETGESLGLTPEEAVEHLKSVQPRSLSNHCLEKCVLAMLGFIDDDATGTEIGCNSCSMEDPWEHVFSKSCTSSKSSKCMSSKSSKSSKHGWANTLAICLVRN
eukprot:CAMPEP_0172670616 /NCGR_PEP_ID=MMETSP1074-20121228/10406_1 /TAXON_ID=2916 /ORGANISM="Ceratium fusus, Strain PA161109" /LENGTH=239 /DNA_ID=CAMNT_0013487549 /DNA_START=63 /DNA_END=782 /DNA_ORIENTATION=+